MESPWKNTVIRQDKHIHCNTENSGYIKGKLFTMTGTTLKQGPTSVMEDKFVTETDVNSSNQEWILTSAKERRYPITQQKDYFFLFKILCCLDIASAT